MLVSTGVVGQKVDLSNSISFDSNSGVEKELLERKGMWRRKIENDARHTLGVKHNVTSKWLVLV